MNKIAFGKNLRTIRRKAGLNQQELGDLIGTSNNMVCFYEKGHYIPTLDRFVALCLALGVAPEALLNGAMGKSPRTGPQGRRRARA